MAKTSKNALENAGEIIERFGGIRPMAAKIDTPVTTVQGWKKRDVIPGTRRDQIISAAQENNIDISDLNISAANGNSSRGSNASSSAKKKTQSKTSKTLPRPKPAETKSTSTKKETTTFPAATAPSDTIKKSSPAKDRDAFEKEVASMPSAPKRQNATSSNHDDLMQRIETNSKKTMVASAWITTGLILLALIAAAFLLWPSMKNNAEKIDAQTQEIEVLKTEVEEAQEKVSLFDRVVPEEIKAEVQNLQNQATNIQNKVQELSVQADEISTTVLGSDAGPLSQRLSALEGQIGQMSGGNPDISALISRISSLEQSIPGQAQLSASVEQLRDMVENNSEGQAALKQDLSEAQNGEEGALGETLEGVSGNDLKAAAMLIAFSQLRDSLNREEPFQNDLVLLEKLAGEDNPELQAALDKLAPHADGGVLTARGLSGEFKGLAGDIVVSSLKGEDISFKEKAKARIGNLIQVEKDGELVTGTDTQVTVDKAQKFLNDGDIQGAISTLQSLKGPAAQEAQPFIEQAQISLLAQNVEQMLGTNILSKITNKLPMDNIMNQVNGGAQGGNAGSVSGALDGAMGGVSGGLDMNEVKKNLESAVPTIGGGGEVIRDEESGIVIYPNEPSFKGFSGGIDQ